MLGDFNKVVVTQGSISGGRDCHIKRCKCRDSYMVFFDDGSVSLSRYFGASCKKHLSVVVDRAWEHNNKLKLKYKKQEKIKTK